MQGFWASLLNNASAGEYAAFTLIAAKATYWQVAVITLIANARYLLMTVPWPSGLRRVRRSGTGWSLGMT